MREDMERTYCPTCFSYYYSCPGCHCSVCDCTSATCLCPDDDAVRILTAYLEEYEIPESIKERQDAE